MCINASKQTDHPNCAHTLSVQTSLLALFVLTDDSSVCINAAQDEPYLFILVFNRVFKIV